MEHHLLPANRLEAFSDGVFAIAITLLILDLRVPESPDRLVSQLSAEWPSLLGYLVSFAFIGGSWLAHAALTHLLRVTDVALVSLNLLQLLFVSFLPFSTSLLTKHLTGSAEHIAVVIFGVNLTLGTLVSGLMVSYVVRTDELKSSVDPARAAWLERQRWMTVALFAMSTALSAFFPKLAVGFYLLFSLALIGQPVWRLSRRAFARRQQGRSRDDSDPGERGEPGRRRGEG